MTKQKLKEIENIESLPSLNIGVVGHIDHGKTTLLNKLTGKWTDSHSEELKRGITIKLGYADCIIREDNGKLNLESGKPVRYISFVDAPGHEMLMATMLSGSAMIDAAILIIAANEGIKPQTREHFMALQSKGIKNLIVAQNKIDLVTKEEAFKNYQEIKNFLKGTFAENSPVIPCSCHQDINIDILLEEIYKLEIPERDLKSEPFFVVARSFDINRPGTKILELKGGVLGGILKKGILKKGDEIEIKPGLTLKKENQIVYEVLKTKIISLYKGSSEVEKATPGGSIAIQTQLDPSLTKSDLLAGCVVSKKGSLPEISNKVRVSFEVFDEVYIGGKHIKIEKIKMSEILLLSINTSTTIGTVSSISNNTIELKLRVPVTAVKNDTLGIARNFKGHWRLIGYGKIL
jgi:translation initiation factor 2 subunit 3